ncbi:hypothetical protein FO519_007940 [Halicephalobus sp. NKZ332]|nr:hypothetical protein FO519_007940 [Halicephalobus sp. NKZ332]
MTETEEKEIPIEHGTVVNVSFGKNQPPVLMNALDSLLTFPSIQRYQKRNSDVLDQNSNHIRPIDDRDDSVIILKVGRSHKPSKSVDEVMLTDSLRLKHRPKLESEERSMIGTTVASYLDAFKLPPPGTEKITPGFVAQKREIYSREIARPMRINPRQRSFSSNSGEDSDEHEKRKLSRRQSAPHQRKPKITITGISTKDLETDKSSKLPTSDLPASFYLLKKSQESAQVKKNTENKEYSPSYKTIIRFGKNREIIPDPEDDRPMPQPVLKSGEVKLRSTTFVENTSPQHDSPPSGPSGRSSTTPDLLKFKTSPSERLSPESIRRQCDEIYRIVQTHGCQLPQGFEVNGALPYYYYSAGNESGYNTLKEPSPLKRMHSNGSTKSSSPSTTSGGGNLPPMQHPLHIAFEPFDKLKNTSKVENPEAEIDRLQRELYDAQVCVSSKLKN